jgi:hypothetical protein
MSTPELFNQAISYLHEWKPEIIIAECGIIDCRPEAFTEFQKTIINNLTSPLWKFAGILRKKMYSPFLIKRRQVYRVTPKKFFKCLNKIKMIFDSSKVFWLEICAGNEYEIARPGVLKRKEEYNSILKEVFEDDFIEIFDDLKNKSGFNSDNFHWNKIGHELIANKIITRIDTFLLNNNA